jgi:hypothetical protein
MPEIEAMIQRKRIEIKNARNISEKQRLNRVRRSGMAKGRSEIS